MHIPVAQFVLVLAFGVLLPNVHGYKFLVYNPRFGKSHVLFMGKLADLLAEAGHEVVSAPSRLRIDRKSDAA